MEQHVLDDPADPPTRPRAIRADDWVAGGIGALLLLYAVLRAAVLPILFDEAFTCLFFVGEPVSTLLNPLGSDLPIDANNHILNTLLIKLCWKLFGPSVFVYRLPNLAALASYLIFSWILVRRYSRLLPPLIGFILLCTNPFLLDLFSAARGYGLSLGFLMPALYLLARELEEGTSSRQRGMLIFLLLAAASLASYLLLNVYAAALLVWFAAALRAARSRTPSSRAGPGISETLSAGAPLLLISAALAAATVPVLWALSKAGGLYWGGKSGFWKDTVGSLVRASLYGAPYRALAQPFLLWGIGAGVAGIAVAASLPDFRRRDPVRKRLTSGISAVGALCAAAILLEHASLGVKFPIDRMAIFFVPLFLLSFWFAIEVGLSSASRALQRGARIGVLLLGMACLAHLGRVGSYRVSYLWQYDLDTPAMLTDLTALRARNPAGVGDIRLGITPFLRMGIDYYRVVWHLGWLAPMDETGPWGADIIYVAPLDEAEALSRGYVILRRYPLTGNFLCISQRLVAPTPTPDRDRKP